MGKIGLENSDRRMVTCDSIYENSVAIPSNRLKFRASAYGVVLQDDKILLLINRSSGKYAFPGGGIEIYETVQEALKREVHEETGIEIDILSFVHFKEHFFYYDPLDEAFHSFMLFYLCRPNSLDLKSDDLVEDDESEKPRWMSLSSLKREDIQRPLREVYDLIIENHERWCM
jgi:8-oxo-dGTP pyrophosphatase MutT (NUDIX family)